MPEVIILIEEMFQFQIGEVTTEAEEAKRAELAEKYDGNIEFVVQKNDNQLHYTPVLIHDRKF